MDFPEAVVRKPFRKGTDQRVISVFVVVGVMRRGAQVSLEHCGFAPKSVCRVHTIVRWPFFARIERCGSGERRQRGAGRRKGTSGPREKRAATTQAIAVDTTHPTLPL